MINEYKKTLKILNRRLNNSGPLKERIDMFFIRMRVGISRFFWTKQRVDLVFSNGSICSTPLDPETELIIIKGKKVDTMSKEKYFVGELSKNIRKDVIKACKKDNICSEQF